MKNLFLVCVFCFTGLVCNADCAQDVANRMATTRTLRHYSKPDGRTYRYEGVGYGSTQEIAYDKCCYSNSRLEVVDVGFARDYRGNWYCCKRYK